MAASPLPTWREEAAPVNLGVVAVVEGDEVTMVPLLLGAEPGKSG